MVKSLDHLIRHVVDEIALCGEEGKIYVFFVFKEVFHTAPFSLFLGYPMVSQQSFSFPDSRLGVSRNQHST